MRRTPPYANKHKSHGTQKQLIEGQTIQWPTENGQKRQTTKWNTLHRKVKI